MRPTLNVNRHRVDGVAEAVRSECRWVLTVLAFFAHRIEATPLQHDGMLAPRQAVLLESCREAADVAPGVKSDSRIARRRWQHQQQ